jgi:CBS domain-containing protein
MKIRDVMTRDVVTITPNVGIQEIYRLFCKKGFGGLPVVTKEGRVVGMVTKNELLAVILPDYFGMIENFLFIDDFGALDKELDSLPELNLFLAEDLMVRNVITIDANASLLKAPVLMHKHNIKHLPVTEEGRLVGIITRSDILKALLEQGKGAL